MALFAAAMPGLRSRVDRAAAVQSQTSLHCVRRNLQTRRRILRRRDYGERCRDRSRYPTDLLRMFAVGSRRSGDAHDSIRDRNCVSHSLLPSQLEFVAGDGSSERRFAFGKSHGQEGRLAAAGPMT